MPLHRTLLHDYKQYLRVDLVFSLRPRRRFCGDARFSLIVAGSTRSREPTASKRSGHPAFSKKSVDSSVLREELPPGLALFQARLNVATCLRSIGDAVDRQERTMDNQISTDGDDIGAMAQRYTRDMLEALAEVINSAKSGQRARQFAREQLEARLNQLGDSIISSDLRCELEDTLRRDSFS
jgi:hypothetical protein